MSTIRHNENFITVQIRDVYGKATCYPVDTDAKRFASIAGTKTLTQTTLIQVLGLRYAIAVADGYGNISRVFRATDLHPMCDVIAA
jgi:hypothetical protein